MPRRLTTAINIRLTPAERAEIRAASTAAGLSISSYGRRRLLGHPVIAGADAAAMNQLRSLAGLLVHLDVRAGRAVSAKTRETRAKITAAIDRIGAAENAAPK